MIRLGFVATAAVALVMVVPAGCAHMPPAAKSCAADVTPQLIATAGAALLGQDYEGAVARELAGLAACLVFAAVERATDEAKRLKLSGDVDQAALARHGDAWMRDHPRPPGA